MFGFRTAWRRIAFVLGGVCLGGALTFSGDLVAADNKNNDKKNNDANNKAEAPRGLGTGLPPQLAGVPVLDLPACKALALAKQPALAVAHAGHQAALARQRGLDTVRVPNFLARDLPIRKQQAAVGVDVAHLEIQRVQLDAVYAVTYSYLSAQYAAEQRAMLEDARTRLLELRNEVPKGIAAGKTNFRKEDLNRIDVTLRFLDSRLEEAAQGEQRAMSALREALGIDSHSPLILRAAGLPRLTPTLDRERLISLALARRPEIQQASLLCQVHGLEVEAQGTRRLFPTAPTFAAGSDLHARPLPAGQYDEQYRPAAIGPDMPVTINGDCGARAEIARAYQQRCGPMLEKTKLLLTLETEQAYFRYLEASRKLPLLQESLTHAREVFETTRSLVIGGKREGTVPNLLLSGTQVSELRGQINLTRYQLLVALAGLERATACGYQPAFELAPTTDPPEPKKPQEKQKKDDDDAEKLNAPREEKDEGEIMGKPKAGSGPRL